jgi:glycosyltransferase involved in cell wall biosynthesis
MTDPIVSAVVSAYNCAPYIADAITSLTTQSLTNIEIIVVDDGSDDETAAIVQAIADVDPRVVLIRRPSNSGRPACAKNVGISAARGRYIAFLDGDDLSYPDRLLHTVTAMQQAGAEFGFTDLVRLHEDGVIDTDGVLATRNFINDAAAYLTYDRGIYVCRNFMGYMLSHPSPVHISTIICARALVDDGTPWFTDAFVGAEDMDLFYRFVASARMVFLPEVATVYRRHDQSITSRRPLQTLIAGIDVREKYFRIHRDDISSTDRERARRYLSAILLDVTYGTWADGDGKTARSYCLRSMRLRPSWAAARAYVKSFIPRQRALAALRRTAIATE